MYPRRVLLRYLSVIGDAPEAFVILLAAFSVSMLAGLAFHEFSHAAVADRLGDMTPRRLGRLTLDPRAHLDPIGSSLIFFVGFGWAKPVPVNPLSTANPKQAMALIASAGPLSNLAMAALAGLPIRLGLVPFYHPFVAPSEASLWAQIWTQSTGDLVGLFLGTIVLLNVILAVFNLIPIAPLDGFRVAVGLLPDELSRPLARLEPWGMGILMLLVFMPFFAGFSPLFTVMGPFLEVFLRLFAGDAGGLAFG